MPIARRQDEPGSLHHVINRGIARRTTFETRRDCRYLLALFARAVRRKLIVLEEFALMTTHFHALVRCLDGNLSRTIGWIEQRFVRWFNRGRRRDGPLFRSRFRSYRIWSRPHERAVRLYIAENAVVARLAPRADLYAWSSAAFRAQSRPPRWLAPARPIAPYASDAERAAGRWLVERSFHGTRARSRVAATESLLDAAPDAVREWMERKARLADGTVPGIAVAAPTMIDAMLAEAPEPPGLRTGDGRMCTDERLAARVLLLRSLAGLSWQEIAHHCRVPRSTAQGAAQRHVQLARADERYRQWATQIALRAVEGSTGERGETKSVPELPADVSRVGTPAIRSAGASGRGR